MLKRNEKMEKNPSVREIKCPFCGRKKTVREMDEDIFYCTYCEKAFRGKEAEVSKGER